METGRGVVGQRSEGSHTCLTQTLLLPPVSPRTTGLERVTCTYSFTLGLGDIGDKYYFV